MDLLPGSRNSSIACSHILLCVLHIILKLNIMKSYSYKNSRKESENQNLWDAFVNYLESTYFPGASEILEPKLLAFEYNAFKECYSV